MDFLNPQKADFYEEKEGYMTLIFRSLLRNSGELLSVEGSDSS